jgi:hypothetical protein
MSWSIGCMYDGAAKDWRFRQTGLQIGIPEWNGSVFIGRTKEGYSMVKVIVGYYGWTMERQPVLDAFIPILADGLRWSGYLPKPGQRHRPGAIASRGVSRAVLHRHGPVRGDPHRHGRRGGLLPDRTVDVRFGI